MKRRIISVISLLLVLVMAFVSCGDKKNVEPRVDNPITAEGVFNNFLSFKQAEEVNPINMSAHLNDTLGNTYKSVGDYVIFVKETKDRLNNLTETYSIYSIADKAVAFTITNTYADEWGWDDDFGNETYPAKVIDAVDVSYVDDIVYFIADWTAYTPIDEKIIEEEELDWSYTEKEYSEFYDVEGNLIATSHVEHDGSVIAENDYYAVISFGRTAAIFDKETSKVVRTYDADVEALPRLYDYMDEYYGYMLNVPVGGISPATNSFIAMARTAIRVYDKEDDLILEYVHGDGALLRNVEVLQGGDILIQNISVATTVDFDYLLDGTKVNIDTFILDVETGKITELADFAYLVDGVYFAADVLKENDAYTFTENVRNIAYAKSIVDDKYYTIFFDNFGTVNFVFDGKIAYEKEDSASLYVEQCTVLAEDRLLIDLASGVAKRAIIDNSGNVIAYLNEDCIVLDDFVITIDSDCSINVYDFDMKFVRTIGNGWAMSYINLDDSVKYYGVIGNTVLFSVVDNYYDYFENESIPRQSYKVCFVDVEYNRTNIRYDCSFVPFMQIESEGIVIVKKETKDLTAPLYLVINSEDKVILTVSAYSVNVVYSEDKVVLLEFNTADGVQTYLLDNTDPYYHKEEYHPDYDDGKDQYEDGDDEGGKY